MTITIEETLHGGIILELLSALAKEKKRCITLFEGKNAWLYFEIQKVKKILIFWKDEQKHKIGCYIKTSQHDEVPGDILL